MAIRKLETIHDLEELNLKSETLRTLKAVNVDVQELVSAAREDFVRQSYGWKTSRLTIYSGIGEVRAKEIMAAIDEAGFILHESEASHRVRRLVTAVFGSPQIFLEHYEDLEDMSNEALLAVNEVIHETLGYRELQVIELRFGFRGMQAFESGCFAFKDKKPLTFRECANNLGTTEERVRQLESKALARLRYPSRRSKLEVATCYSREALSRRMLELWSDIGELQLELDKLKSCNPYPEIATEVDGMPIGDLDFSVRTYNCLMRAGIHTVGELCKYTDNDLLNIRNFSAKSLEEVCTTLRGMGLALAS